MSKGVQSDFYHSPEWVRCREDYLKSVGGLCEDCLAKGIYEPAVIVHHIKPINRTNVYDPEITLSFNNLRAVCRLCHGRYHSNKKRYQIDEYGQTKIISE